MNVQRCEKALNAAVVSREGQMYHQYPPVAVSVDAPQLDVGLGSDGGGSRCAVDQSQLSKAAALSDAGDPLTVHIHLRRNAVVSFTAVMWRVELSTNPVWDFILSIYSLFSSS